MSQTQTIPVLDLFDYTKGSRAARERFATDLGKALSEVGFFALENHGVPSTLIQEAYKVAADFFLLPEDTKRRYEDLALKGQRGYTSFGREHAKDAKAADLKEFWHVGRELETSHRLRSQYPANIWPNEPTNFKPCLSQLYTALDACAAHLLEAAALAIDEEMHRFSEIATDGNSILRIIHYPPVPDDRNPQSIRAAAHEDINLITLLCESTAAGLELLDRQGKWIPIHSLKGQIIVDAGDMLQNISNGVYRSTTHRVVNPDNSRERRFSMPFFVHPRGEASLNPLQSCINRQNNQKKYPDITAGEYLAKRLKEIGLG
jgi:isopenicillin N synthase-like dioxygenase